MFNIVNNLKQIFVTIRILYDTSDLAVLK